jgi:hypothetical protein
MTLIAGAASSAGRCRRRCAWPAPRPARPRWRRAGYRTTATPLILRLRSGCRPCRGRTSNLEAILDVFATATTAASALASSAGRMNGVRARAGVLHLWKKSPPTERPLRRFLAVIVCGRVPYSTRWRVGAAGLDRRFTTRDRRRALVVTLRLSRARPIRCGSQPAPPAGSPGRGRPRAQAPRSHVALELDRQLLQELVQLGEAVDVDNCSAIRRSLPGALPLGITRAARRSADAWPSAARRSARAHLEVRLLEAQDLEVGAAIHHQDARVPGRSST